MFCDTLSVTTVFIQIQSIARLMSYRFRVKESIPRGIRRIGREQINASLQALSQAEDIHQAIHQARKRIKCLRSLLHLVRPGIEASVFKAQDKGYRNIGRQLAGARDAKVLLETLTKLENRPEEWKEKINTSPIRTWLLAQYRNTELAFDRARLESIRHELQDRKKQFSTMPLKQVEFFDICEGARSTYQNGRAAILYAVKTQDGEHFHDWRKNAQRHWRQIQLLRPCWPPMIDMRAKFAHELCQLLGDDHDLEVFSAMLKKNNSLFRGKLDLEALQLRIRNAQEDLRRSSVTHGQLLYAEKSRHFHQRLTACWNASVKS